MDYFLPECQFTFSSQSGLLCSGMSGLLCSGMGGLLCSGMGGLLCSGMGGLLCSGIITFKEKQNSMTLKIAKFLAAAILLLALIKMPSGEPVFECREPVFECQVVAKAGGHLKQVSVKLG